MMSTDQPLPDFGKPPLNEVVLSVQFEALELLNIPHLGLIWQAFRDRFPKTEEHASLDPVFERFGLRPTVGPQVQVYSSPPSPRLWFLNKAETELIQVQKDRFIRNWRKKEDNEPYPRYKRLRKFFLEDYEQFIQFVEGQGWGQIVANQCEVSYVNLILCGNGWNDCGEVENVITFISSTYSDSGLGDPEKVIANVSYILQDVSGGFAGRLHVEVKPVLRTTDRKPAIRLSLTARGKPEREGIDGVMRFLDRGREEIVRGFTSITTKSMHKVWDRRL
ncbi:MAG: TIGR04255 family protein [Pirellulales bacterium]